MPGPSALSVSEKTLVSIFKTGPFISASKLCFGAFFVRIKRFLPFIDLKAERYISFYCAGLLSIAVSEIVKSNIKVLKASVE